MNANHVRALLHELIDENPFAIRAVLKILCVEFTTAVPTLAVTNEPRPRLLINLEFITRECHTDEHVKAVLCHEFLHVLLRHTSITKRLTPARHLALDAIINAIIHRQLGEKYSDMMSSYYKDLQGIRKLLRPMTAAEADNDIRRARRRPLPSWWQAWHALYAGNLLADDIEQLAEDLSKPGNGGPGTVGKRARKGDRINDTDLRDRLLGNHDDEEAAPVSDALEQALDRARLEMNGGGIWRNAGPGGHPYEMLVNPKHAALAAWKAKTLAVLRRHLAPAPGAPRTPVPTQACLPVLSTSDRRSFLRATWSPFLPEARWSATVQRPEGRAQVYLDVSGLDERRDAVDRRAARPRVGVRSAGRSGRSARRWCQR